MVKNKSSNTIISILVLAAIITMAAAATSVYYSFFYIKGTAQLPLFVVVNKTAGFNLEKDSLNFGSLPPGSCSVRGVSVENNGEPKTNIKIAVKVDGELSKWITARAQNILLKPGEKAKLDFSLCIPENTPYGSYSGTAYFLVKKD